jgi:two-component system, chemotaxis family, chemotaxis protein CheY
MAATPFARWILVVDDDTALLDFLDLALPRAGYDVRTARSGAEALSCIGTTRPDLILLDINMPVMDGWEFARRLRALKGFASIPIVIMSVDLHAGERLRQINAQGFLAKPFQIQQVLEEIERLLPARPGQNSHAKLQRNKLPKLR